MKRDRSWKGGGQEDECKGRLKEGGQEDEVEGKFEGENRGMKC